MLGGDPLVVAYFSSLLIREIEDDGTGRELVVNHILIRIRLSQVPDMQNCFL